MTPLTKVLNSELRFRDIPNPLRGQLRKGINQLCQWAELRHNLLTGNSHTITRSSHGTGPTICKTSLSSSMPNDVLLILL
ncbi:hypothetical protein Syn6312_0281 [Synechococcus sp. PCC 6312]|nr:hypothetical protein Syn6312_0281 [Synechococcus sp. PCC 6312]